MITCTEAQRLIDPYLDKKISDKDLEAFLDHIDHCPSCREELDISLKIRRVLQDVENDSSNNDYHDLLDQELKASRKHLRNVRMETRIYRIAAAVSIIVLAVIISESVYEQAAENGGGFIKDFFSGRESRQREQTETDVYSEQVSESITEIASRTADQSGTGQRSGAPAAAASTRTREYSETLIDGPEDEEDDNHERETDID